MHLRSCFFTTCTYNNLLFVITLSLTRCGKVHLFGPVFCTVSHTKQSDKYLQYFWVQQEKSTPTLLWLIFRKIIKWQIVRTRTFLEKYCQSTQSSTRFLVVTVSEAKAEYTLSRLKKNICWSLCGGLGKAQNRVQLLRCTDTALLSLSRLKPTVGCLMTSSSS